MTFENCDVDVRGNAPRTSPDGLGKIYGIGRFLGGTRYNRMQYCKLIADRHNIGFSIAGTTVKPTRGNRIEDCEITADGAQWVIRVASPGGEGAGEHVVIHNRAGGDGAQGSILIGGGTNNCEVTYNVVSQGVKNFGSNNTVSGNAEEDAAGVGPR